MWELNIDSVTAFLACATQWRAAAGPSGLVRLGLDYAGVDIALTRRGCDDAKTFDDIQIMEAAALEAWSRETPA